MPLSVLRLAPLQAFRGLHDRVSCDRVFRDRMYLSRDAGVCNASAPCDKACSDASPARATGHVTHNCFVRTSAAAFVRHAVLRGQRRVLHKCSLFVLYHRYGLGASGAGRKAQSADGPPVLRMRGGPAAEFRQLKGGVKSKPLPLLRRCYSFLHVDEVTYRTVVTETEGRSW